MNNKYISASFFYLRGIPAALTELFKKYNESNLRIRQKGRLSTDAKQSDIFQAERDKRNELEQLKTDTLKELADIEQAARAKQEIADRQLERELGGRVPTANTAENLLNETREHKAWLRIKPLLDRHSDVEPLTAEIKTLVAGFIQPLDPSPGAYDASDFDSIAAIKKELPFYIKGRFSAAEAGIYTEQSINAFEEALANVRPEYREAVNLKKELRTGMIQINTAFNYVKTAIENNEPETIIPVWEKGETTWVK